MKLYIIYKIKYFSAVGRKELKIKVKSLLEKILKEEKTNIASLNVILCDDELIKKYNKEYLKHDYETDIITFYDTNKSGATEGELLISIETVKYNSKRFRTEFYDELMRVIIHGILHLCNYDDSTAKQKKIMVKKENYYLKYI